MMNREQLEILMQGVGVWNEWRKENSLVIPTLDGIYLDGKDLEGVNLQGASLKGAFFRKANLKGANFNSVNLRRANMSDANLFGANLSESNMDGANLEGANLTEVKFIYTQFSYTYVNNSNFRNSIFASTVFANLFLNTTKELETAQHLGRSSIGIDTIQNSEGKIPEIFLRGCGLSDWEIEAAKLYTPGLDPEHVTDITYKINQLFFGEGIQYYSCFISYNSKDEKFAKQLHDDLQNNGVRCWFAPEDMKIGDQIRPTIDRQIRLRDKLLVILSENSVKSEWVGDEVEAALEEEKASGRLVLFPVRLDNAVMETRDDWAAKIKRRRHIGDFSNWKDEGSYRKAFERLLRNLKAIG